MANWLDALLGGIKTILEAGTEKPLRAKLNFSSGFTVTDNPGQERLDISVSGTSPYNSTPAAVGTAAAGASALYARGDHVHAHGNQSNGSQHTEATSLLAGFLSAAFWSLLNAATDAATAGTLVKRDGSAFAAFAKVITPLVESAQASLAVRPAARSTAGAGYAVTVGGGAGNTPGTDLAGGCNVDLGRTVGGTSAKCAFLTNTGGASTERLYVECVSGGVRQWALSDVLDLYGGSGLTLRTSGYCTVTAASLLYLQATTSANWLAGDGTTKLVTVVANAFTHTFDSLVTSIVDTITKRTGTGANAGASRTTTAQDGQNVAAGTNNNGGAFVTGSGAAGTGGSAGRAGHWDANVGGVLAFRLDGADMSAQFTGAYLESAGQVSSQPQTYAHAGTVTLDGSGGNHHELGTLTGNITSLEHGSSLRPGSLHTVQAKMNGTGGYSITWDTEFKFGDTFSDQPLGDANARTIWLFRVDSAGDIHCIGRETFAS